MPPFLGKKRCPGQGVRQCPPDEGGWLQDLPSSCLPVCTDHRPPVILGCTLGVGRVFKRLYSALNFIGCSPLAPPASGDGVVG